MIVHVKTLAGKEVAIEVANEDVTVDDFKLLVERDFDLPPREQGFAAMERDGADNQASRMGFLDAEGGKSLADFGVVDGHTLVLVQRFVGEA